MPRPNYPRSLERETTTTSWCCDATEVYRGADGTALVPEQAVSEHGAEMATQAVPVAVPRAAATPQAAAAPQASTAHLFEAATPARVGKEKVPDQCDQPSPELAFEEKGEKEEKEEDLLKAPLPSCPLPQGLEDTLSALRAQEAFFRALCDHHLLWESRVEQALAMQSAGIADAVVQAVVQQIQQGGLKFRRDAATANPANSPTATATTKKSKTQESPSADSAQAHKKGGSKVKNQIMVPGTLTKRWSVAPDGLEDVNAHSHEDEEEERSWFALQVEIALSSRAAEIIVASLIVLNAACIGIQIDWGIRHMGEPDPAYFSYLDVFFTLAFSIELFLRIYVERSVFYSRKNDNFSWNVFDTYLVGVSLAEMGLLVLQSVEGPLSRVVRMARVARLLRLVRIMQFGRDLRIMVKGITSSVMPLFWAVIVLVLVNFLFSTTILQLLLDRFEVEGIPGKLSDELHIHFNSLARAMYTLWMSIVGGIDWGNVAEPLLDVNIICTSTFITYVAMSLLCVLNIITGVFVESANKNAKLDKELHFLQEQAAQRQWMKEVRAIFRITDQDHSGTMSLEELKQAMENPRLRSHLNRIGLDASPESVENLFNIIDTDTSGEIECEEFIQGLTEIQGEARRIDIVRQMNEIRGCRSDVQEMLGHLRNLL